MALDINPKRIVESMKLTKQSGRFHGRGKKSSVLCLSALVDPTCLMFNVGKICCVCACVEMMLLYTILSYLQ